MEKLNIETKPTNYLKLKAIEEKINEIIEELNNKSDIIIEREEDKNGIN